MKRAQVFNQDSFNLGLLWIGYFKCLNRFSNQGVIIDLDSFNILTEEKMTSPFHPS